VKTTVDGLGGCAQGAPSLCTSIWKPQGKERAETTWTISFPEEQGKPEATHLCAWDQEALVGLPVRRVMWDVEPPLQVLGRVTEGPCWVCYRAHWCGFPADTHPDPKADF
jgi:hypothetical protein